MGRDAAIGLDLELIRQEKRKRNVFVLVGTVHVIVYRGNATKRAFLQGTARNAREVIRGIQNSRPLQ
jgi:hypothetical protein